MLLDLRTVADLAGISDRNARKAVDKTLSDGTYRWRGTRLEIVQLHGRGGRAGKVYAVEESSLPPEIQLRLKASQTPVETRSIEPREATAKQHLWWTEFLRAALEHPPRSSERAAALAELADARTFDWDGKPFVPKLRTLQRQAKRHDDNVTAAHRTRADKGSRRTIVSREWDKAVPFDDKTKERIAHDLRQDIRGLVKDGAARGIVVVLASNKLKTLTRAESFGFDKPQLLDRICKVPRHLVDAEWKYRQVAVFKRDRKAYEDAKPRTRRTIAGMRPMEVVVADVHPVDVHLVRSDGSIATARFIAFMDIATQRVRGRLVLLDKGQSVRNVDVIEAFADMVEDPAWGMPEAFYVDNGSEYNFADFLGDAMELVVQGFHGPSRSSRIIRAMPYNASAKPIERFFGDFEKRYLSSLPGWIGGNRMAKKQEAIGRTVAPFGTIEAFAPAFFGLLRAYHVIEQGAKTQLKGRSPDRAFQDHLDAGWSSCVMSRDEIRAACSKSEERTNVQGSIEALGQFWTCPELRFSPDKRVLVRLPVYHQPAELLILRMNGERLGIAAPSREYSYLDTAGAADAGEGSGQRRSAIRELDKSAPDVSTAQRLISFEQDAARPQAGEPAGVVRFDPEQRPALALPSPRKRRGDAAADQEARWREAEEIRSIRSSFLDKKAG